VKFTGVVQLIPRGQAFPEIVVVDQPWTFKKGTGAYEHLAGSGKRSTFKDGCHDEFCIRYTGKITHQ